jgi:Flp pilus assembly pilin Flp
MIKSIKVFLASIIAASTLLVPVMMPVMAHAEVANLAGSLCGGLEFNANGQSCGNSANQNNTLNNVIGTVINVFSVIVGFISIVMIIYGGFKYVTSGGDSGKVTSAKNTILYALIGIVIVALAQVLVRYVFAKANSTIAA